MAHLKVLEGMSVLTTLVGIQLPVIPQDLLPIMMSHH